VDLGGIGWAKWRIGEFGGTVACKTLEVDYIWSCNITKISSSFPLRDVVVSRRAGHNGQFSAKYWRWEGRSPRKF
jgi:hypothetical protein